MKQLNNVEFNSDEISALNDLLDARELTGQIPETMPTGLYGENNLSISNDDNCNCGPNNCNCGPYNCNCGFCGGGYCNCDGSYCNCNCGSGKCNCNCNNNG